MMSPYASYIVALEYDQPVALLMANPHAVPSCTAETHSICTDKHILQMRAYKGTQW